MVNGSRYNHISKTSLGSSILKISKVVLRLRGLIFSKSGEINLCTFKSFKRDCPYLHQGCYCGSALGSNFP